MLLFLIPLKKGLAQDVVRERHLWFDGLIGQTNSGVFKGVRYVNAFRTINEKHQFFRTTDFKMGSVHLNGQDYFELPLLYDVYLDELLTMNVDLPNRPIAVLDRASVASFSVQGHSFQFLSREAAQTEASGFFEVLLKDNAVTLYKKHLKKMFKRTDAQNLYYEFKDGYSYLLFSEGAYYPFRKANDLNAIFPQFRKDLKSILKKHSALKKSDSDSYIMAVLKDLLSAALPKKEAL